MHIVKVTCCVVSFEVMTAELKYALTALDHTSLIIPALYSLDDYFTYCLLKPPSLLLSFLLVNAPNSHSIEKLEVTENFCSQSCDTTTVHPALALSFTLPSLLFLWMNHPCCFLKPVTFN